jgi:hypothetical protein
LRIPSNQDIIVTDLYDVENSGRRPRKLSRRIVLEYMWREEFELKGEEYAGLEGRTTSLLCGGTLVFDDEGNLLSCFRKPGSKYETIWDYRKKVKTGLQDKAEGERRLESLKEFIADQVEQGRVGLEENEEGGYFAGLAPPMIARSVEGSVQFEISPHLSIEEDEEMDDLGGRKWAISF